MRDSPAVECVALLAISVEVCLRAAIVPNFYIAFAVKRADAS
jgi:hypothetical protein